jgi:muramoyltetrapeptide carboxypeptidase LdcA involved in peptidoglycan recycling
MIHQIKIGWHFRQVSALIVGQFSDYTEDPLMYASLNDPS